ncbi:MAG: hypothetical protein EON56_04920 [Alphaproteobacteria bacterium]|nr:MAG: hypothetical protein EON56_04920 [Alphaproteobacteria bacterium]
MLESFYIPTHHMARGARYPLLDHAVAVEWATSTTSGVVLSAAAMFLAFYGQEYVERNILSLYTALNAIRETQPLDGNSLAREVGISRYPYWRAT